ncbi:MAG TPA: hypothetical protein VJ579_04270 [Candidatus Paceibacterota bacterium]|nr:hypothetical protein [Candidatus Paceibacterota bacterium]
MSSPLRANSSGLMPLATHLAFDIKGILGLSSPYALSLAKHTVQRLNEMEAPSWAYQQLVKDCFLMLPELNSNWIIQAQARDFFRLIMMCGEHLDKATKDEVILVARRFRDYNILRSAVQKLHDRSLSQFEIKEAVDLLHVSSSQFSEVASLMCLDAFKMHGLEFRKEIKEMLVKKHGEWVEFEPEHKDAIPV